MAAYVAADVASDFAGQIEDIAKGARLVPAAVPIVESLRAEVKKRVLCYVEAYAGGNALFQQGKKEGRGSGQRREKWGNRVI